MCSGLDCFTREAHFAVDMLPTKSGALPSLPDASVSLSTPAGMRIRFPGRSIEAALQADSGASDPSERQPSGNATVTECQQVAVSGCAQVCDGSSLALGSWGPGSL